MDIPVEYDTLLSKVGVSLADLGFREVALSRENALLAVDLLRRAGRPIFGGDVYYRRGTSIESAVASWYAEPRSLEDPESFMRRSWETAEAYITAFPERRFAEPLFSIVIGDMKRFYIKAK
jgi:hypothetical protein